MRTSAEIGRNDPELAATLDGFIAEVEGEGDRIDPRTRHIAVLSALIGCQAVDAFPMEVDTALDDGVDPGAIREVVYQSFAYTGVGRALPFVSAMDGVFGKAGIDMPLGYAGTVSRQDRIEAGSQVQAEIFGDAMRDAWKAGRINRWLAGNCFGDYYTRRNLSLREREIATFCYLMAQGGCEPQLEAHIHGNMNIGNGPDLLREVVHQCLPYIGYPRSLNAMACIARVDEDRT